MLCAEQKMHRELRYHEEMREYRKKIAKTSVGKTTGSIRGAEIEGVAKWGWPLEGQHGP